MSTQVTYKGNTIANFTNDTKTLKTAGKYMEDDVTITEVIAGQGNVWQDEDGYVHLDDESGLDFQAKSVNPTESSQTVKPDAGYTALSQVTVGAISSNYIGTNVARKSAADLTASGSTVTVPVGYYSSQVTKNISGGQAFTPAVTITTNPTFSLVSSTGKLTAAYTGSSNITPTVTAGYIAAGTSGKITTTGTSTYTLTTQAATTYNVSTADQTIASYRWLTGAQTIKSVTTENILASNIKSGVTVKVGDANNASRITQVTGTLVEGVDAPTFTVIWDDNWTAPISATCDKTYAECKNYYDSGIAFSGNVINTNQSHSSQYVGSAVCLGPSYGATAGDERVDYTFYTSRAPEYDLRMYTDGTITITYPSAYVTPLNITQNGTIRNYDYFYDPIIVNVPNSYTATITRTDGQTVSPFAQVNGTGTEYKRNGDSFYFHPGDTIRFYLGSSDYNSKIYVNDKQIYSSYGGYYTYTPPNCDIALEFYRNTSSETSYVKISYDDGGGYTIDDIAMRDVFGAISGSASSIGICAFAGCQSISQANFLSCTAIGSSAFYGCTKLSQISFPMCTTIKSGAFASCVSLMQANFPSCTSIEYAAFHLCTSLTQISFPICASIGALGFYRTRISQAIFPACTYIGSSAFYLCSSLAQVSFPVCTTINEYTFTSCSSLTQVNFPLCTSIKGYAFASCFSLTQASFPVCTSIGTMAFYNCTSLAQVSIPACISIENTAFGSCTSLTQVNIPACRSIGYTAFQSCTSLNTVIMSHSQAMSGLISRGAFNGCFRLLSLYLLTSTYIYSLANYFSSTFSSTPMYGYTEYTGGVYGSIFVPSSIYSTYIKATYWSNASSRFVSLTDAQINNVLNYGRHDP